VLQTIPSPELRVPPEIRVAVEPSAASSATAAAASSRHLWAGSVVMVPLFGKFSENSSSCTTRKGSSSEDSRINRGSAVNTKRPTIIQDPPRRRERQTRTAWLVSHV